MPDGHHDPYSPRRFSSRPHASPPHRWRWDSRSGLFLSLVTVVPFAIGPDLRLLSRIGPAILWIAALLASLLGLDRLFQADQEDGSLDQMFLSPAPLELIVLVKCIAHWFVTGLPLVYALASVWPDVGFGWFRPPIGCSNVVGWYAGLHLSGAIGASLTVTLRRGGLLLSILVVPLAVPVLIFGVSAAQVPQRPFDTVLGPLRARTRVHRARSDSLRPQHFVARESNEHVRRQSFLSGATYVERLRPYPKLRSLD